MALSDVRVSTEETWNAADCILKPRVGVFAFIFIFSLPYKKLTRLWLDDFNKLVDSYSMLLFCVIFNMK